MDNTCKASDLPKSKNLIVDNVYEVLDKLTPNNVEDVVNCFKAISFSNFEEFDEATTLVFEKAVSKQGMDSEMYAKFCHLLAISSFALSTPSASDQEDIEFTFKNLIIQKCQWEFERKCSESTKFLELAEEMIQCKNLNQRAELQANYINEEERLVLRNIGNISFVCELYKSEMINSCMMMTIIENLLKKKDIESLHFLCILLQNIGKDLDACTENSVQLDKYFETMHELATIRKFSSRVTFHLIHVIKLRESNWICTEEDSKSKFQEISLKQANALIEENSALKDSNKKLRISLRQENLKSEELGMTLRAITSQMRSFHAKKDEVVDILRRNDQENEELNSLIEEMSRVEDRAKVEIEALWEKNRALCQELEQMQDRYEVLKNSAKEFSVQPEEKLVKRKKRKRKLGADSASVKEKVCPAEGSL